MLSISIFVAVIFAVAQCERTDRRTVNGDKIKIKEAPYHAQILIDDGEGSYSFCGGAIISNHAILTSKKCMEISTIGGKLRYGTVSAMQESTGFTVPFAQDDWVIDSTNPANPLAVIKLNKRLKLKGGQAQVIPSCRVYPEEEDQIFFTGHEEIWHETHVKKTSLVVVEDGEDGSFLAGGAQKEPTGPCNYDYGGPAVCFAGTRRKCLCGIAIEIKDDPACGKRPAVFASVDYYARFLGPFYRDL